LGATGFGKVPDIFGAVCKRLLCPPFQLFFGSSNFGYTEANVTRSSASFPDGYLSLRCLLKATEDLADCMTSSGSY